MALEFGMFPQKNLYSNNGRLLSESDQEGAARNKTFIARDGNGTNGTTTLYTVPANKVLYITSVQLCVNARQASSSGLGAIYCNPGGTIRRLIYMKLVTDAVTTYTNFSDSVAFLMPIKVEATRTVTLYSQNATVGYTGTFSGWLEDA